MTKLLVVLGATGTQGGSVVKTYLNKKEWRIRAVTRNPNQENAQKLKDCGVEVVAGDLNDEASLRAAFKGAQMVFAVTDFWAPFFNPEARKNLKIGQTINEYCYEVEVAQGKNIAAALMSTLETLDHLIWSSLVDVTKWSGGKYTWVYHFDSKAHIYDFIRDEYPELEKKTSQLFMGSFMDNWKKSASRGPQLQEDGTYALTWCGSPSTLEPFVDVPNDTGHFVEALELVGPQKKLFGVSDLVSGEDFMKIWCKELGVKGYYKQLSYETLMSSIPDQYFAKEVSQSRANHAEFGWLGGEKDVLMPKDLGVKTSSILEYIRSQDWSSIVGELSN